MGFIISWKTLWNVGKLKITKKNPTLYLSLKSIKSIVASANAEFSFPFYKPRDGDQKIVEWIKENSEFVRSQEYTSVKQY